MGLCARDAMTAELATISPNETLADLERLLLGRHIGGVPVVEGERLVGLVTRSDVVRTLSTERTLVEVQLDFYREYHQDPDAPYRRVGEAMEREQTRAAEILAGRLVTLRVRDAMVTSVLTVDADAPLAEVARRLVKDRVHRLVVTERERPVGIVTTTDLVRLVAEGRLG